ncbi:hypothetical protein LTR86_005989 [Recurvomyces mirabilis]|nr:hypothetical protein LTR86_005989 [Recurvomyces mirabilis]
MSWILDLMHGAHNWYHGVPKIVASTRKTDRPLHLGVLGAAAINPGAIFDPVSTHPDIIIAGIAARSRAKAETQIKQCKLQHAKAYDSYDALLGDPDIDAVYNPLPNGLHAEWTIKAMRAGKHVLVEKPIASNAEQVREIKKVADETGKVVLEAFHWRLHPAAHLVKSLVQSGKYGKVLEISAQMGLPAGALAKDDIRFKYDLAGGSSMDLTYAYSAVSYFATPSLYGAEIEVLSAKPRLNATDPNIDDAMDASFTIRKGKDTVLCHTSIDLAAPWLFGVIPPIWKLTATCDIELDKAKISFPNFPGAWLQHSISVTDKATGKVEKYSAYVDGPEWKGRGQRWWTTYRYQLEAFVKGVRAVQGGKTLDEVAKMDEISWVSLEESEAEIAIIDKVYEKTDLPRRK